ncbi:uncharacterized protein V6R79_006589 [Siganus canaliculatus]
MPTFQRQGAVDAFKDMITHKESEHLPRLVHYLFVIATRPTARERTHRGFLIGGRFQREEWPLLTSAPRVHGAHGAHGHAPPVKQRRLSGEAAAGSTEGAGSDSAVEVFSDSEWGGAMVVVCSVRQTANVWRHVHTTLTHCQWVESQSSARSLCHQMTLKTPEEQLNTFLRLFKTEKNHLRPKLNKSKREFTGQRRNGGGGGGCGGSGSVF